jgi:hypothetical protein
MLRIHLLAAAFAAAVSTPALAQATRLNGDVNNDGQVTATDAQAVLSAAVDLSLPNGYDKAYGDADCDGKVTARDAQIILSSVVQLDVSAFCVAKPSGAGVSIVTVDAGTGAVLVGGELQLAAAARDSTNKEITGKVVTWSTSDANRATVSSTGLVKGVSAGTVTISAAVDGKTGAASITVSPASSTTTFTISPATVTVLKDSTVQLSAVIRDALGNPVSGKTITWATSDGAKAIVSSAGLVKGLALGTVTITASSAGLTDATATVAVVSLASTANRTWTGAVSTDWSTAGNWSPSGVPIATDTISVPAGTPNQPELKIASATVAGIVILPNAKLDLGANELQVTGRVDVDGQVTGTGKLTIQGLNQSTSYVRGMLPNVGVAGKTVIVGPTTVTGSLEQVAGSVIDLNGFTVKVTKDLNIRGTLLQNTAASILDVRGNVRFFTDQTTTQTVLSAGTIKAGGNFAVVVPGATVVSPFPSSGTHRVILDGAAKQTVADTGLAVVRFQELLVQNTAGGVEFSAPPATIASQVFQVATRLTASTATPIFGAARVVVFSHFTTPVGGAVTLRNLSVGGVLSAGSDFKPDTLTLIGIAQIVPSGQAYQYQNVVAAGSAALNGTTGFAGGLVIGCITNLSGCTTATGTLDVAGRKLSIGGNLQQASASVGSLFMKTNTDSVVIGGGILGRLAAPDTSEFDVATNSWLHGWLRVAGDVRVKGSGPGGQTGATHTVILDGATQQKLQVKSGFKFNYLTIADSLGVVMNDTTATRTRIVSVSADLNINTAVKLTGSGRMEVAGNVQTTTGSSIENSVMSVGSILRASGGFTPDTAEFTSPTVVQTIQNLPAYRNVVVKGKAIFGGSMTFSGSLIVASGAELNVESRHVQVTKAMLVSGILRMQDSRDSITVLGDSAVFFARNDPLVKNYATAGVLRVRGSLIADSTGFYPTGTHLVVLNGGSANRARGVFQTLEVAGTGQGTGSGFTLKNVVVNGTLTATSHVGKLLVDTLVAAGDALLNPADTVRTLGTTSVNVKGNLTIRTFASSFATGRVAVEGNLTLMDAGTLSGKITYRGNYAEQGTPANVSNADPINGRLASIRWVQQPTNIVAGSPFTPTPSIELVDSSGARLLGVAVVTIPDAANLLAGTKRVLTVNGLAVFTGLTKKVSGFAFLTPRAALPNGTISQPTSTQFNVTAGAAKLIAFLSGTGTVPQVVAGGGPNLIVQATDTLGNATPFAGTVTITAGAGAPDTVYGTKSATLDANGQAQLTVQLRRAGTYTLVPVVTGLTATPTNSFAVVHSNATKVAISVQPGNALAGATVSPLPVMEAQDAFGNWVDNFSISTQPTASLAFVSGPAGAGNGFLTATFVQTAAGRWTATAFKVDIPSGSNGAYVFTASVTLGVNSGYPPATTAQFTITK